MKNLFYLLTLIIFTLTSCDKTTDVENQQIINAVEFGGLKVNLPPNYNKSVLSLSLSDLQNQFYYSKSGGLSKVKSSDYTSITLDRMAILAEEVISKYPNLDSLTAKDISMIKRDFVGMDEKSIPENIDVIDSFYTALSRYDLVRALSTENLSPSLVRSRVTAEYLGYDLNSEEFWYFVWHPALVSPIKKATNKAKELTDSNFPKIIAYQNKADAFRHAIWNVLICKYIGEDKNEISDCTKRADDFTTKHETGATKPSGMTDTDWELDKQMDLHNNAQGRKYFESVAWIVKVGLFKVKRVRAPSEEEIVSGIKGKLNSAQKISTSNDTSKYPSNIVYIID